MSEKHLESEQAVLAAILRWGDIVNLEPEDFADGVNREIYKSITRLQSLNQPVDAFTVGEPINEVGYCMELARSFLLVRENLNAYAERVQQYAARRKAHAAIIDALEKIETEDPACVINELTMKLDQPEKNNAERNIGESLISYVDVLEDRLKSNGLVGLSTGLKNLDELLSGLKRGNLIILAGRPGMGKTTLALNILSHNAIQNNKSVMFVSLEMPESEINDKLISSIGHIKLKNLQNGEAIRTEEDCPRLVSAVSVLRDKKIRVLQDAYKIHQIRASALKTKRKTGLDLLVVDYLQLMQGSGENRTQEVTAISAAFKRLARELNIPVILLSQLNRKCEERANKRPMNSDLRESGGIEQDADVIIMVYRDAVYNEDSEYGNIGEAIITKARMGSLGTAYLYADLSKSRFLDGQKPEVQQRPAKVRSFADYRS